MSEQDKQAEQSAEEKAAEQSDSQSDDASNTDKTDISSDLDGEENKKIDLDDSAEEQAAQKEQNSNKAKEQRDKQVDSWSERYYKGEVELKDVPKWIQKEINEAGSPDVEASDDKKFDERMDKRDDAAKYNSQKTTLNDTSMTADERKTVIKEFKQLKKDGVPPGRALEAAIKIAGVKLVKSDSSVKNPVVSGKENASKDGKSYKEQTANMTDSEKADHLEEIAAW